MASHRMFEEWLTLIARMRTPCTKDDKKMKHFNILASPSLTRHVAVYVMLGLVFKLYIILFPIF